MRKQKENSRSQLKQEAVNFTDVIDTLKSVQCTENQILSKLSAKLIISNFNITIPAIIICIYKCKVNFTETKRKVKKKIHLITIYRPPWNYTKNY